MYLTRRILNNATNGAVLQFKGDNSEFGGIEFNNNLALSSSSPVTMSMQQTFNIDGADAFFSNNLSTSGSLTVADAATLSKTLIVTQGSTLQGTLDVTGESIFASNTTVSGTLKAESDLDFSSAGGNLKAGSINALTVNSAGEVTKIGQDTPQPGEFLKWDSNNNKVVWDAASVTSLPLDSISAANNSSTRIENSGDIHLDSTAGEIFLSSSNNFTFVSDSTASKISLQSTGLTTGVGQINLAVTDRGANKNLSQITFNGLFIRDGNNDASNYLTSFGLHGSEILNTNDHDGSAGILHIGTVNRNTQDDYGQNVTGSLLFSATDRRFIFCDSGRQQSSASMLSKPKPFFHIKKIRSSLTDLNTNFEVELNATKGISSYPLTLWDNTAHYNHATFLKFNQDGEITKLGHDTPTDGQVLTWDNTNGHVVWSDTSSVYSTLDSLTNVEIGATGNALVDGHVLKYNSNNQKWENKPSTPGAQTLSDLTDTDLTTTTPSEGDYLKYVSGEWVPAAVPVSTPTYLSTTNSPITANINYHYSIDTSVRPVVIDLPQAHTSNIGKRIIIKFRTGNNFLTVKPASGQTIENDGNPFEMTPNQTPGQSITLVSNGGNNWEII
jgi:hypothetical protein